VELSRLDNCLWLFKAFWLYGAVEPATGESLFLQFSHVDTQCYQRFLDEFSKAYPDSLNVLQVDNGRFHKGKALIVPENIILLFQPPYCQATFWDERFGGEGFFPKLSREDSPQKLAPELNPIERLWEHLKADLKWASFKTLDQLQAKVDQFLAQLTPEVIASITGYSFILDTLSALKTI
jgi:transposase